jgi:hypothetical protein
MHSLGCGRYNVPALLLLNKRQEIILIFDSKLQFIYPQSLKALRLISSSARLKSCPDTNLLILPMPCTMQHRAVTDLTMTSFVSGHAFRRAVKHFPLIAPLGAACLHPSGIPVRSKSFPRSPFPNRRAPVYLELCMPVATEAVDRKHSAQAETKEFTASKLVFSRFVLQVVVRILQILRDVKNPNPISNLKFPPMPRGAALASSPDFCSLCCSRHFLSTSTYSASITPSSFLA